MSIGKNEFGERLRQKREDMGLSQAAFAAMMGVHRRSQINYETGKRQPPLSYLKALEKAGLDVAYLLNGPGEAGQHLRAAAYFRFLSAIVTLLGISNGRLTVALDDAYRISLDTLRIEDDSLTFDEEKLKREMNKLAMKLLHDEGVQDFS